MRIRILVMNPGFGIAHAVGPMVGQNIGAARINRAAKSAIIGGGLAITLMTLIGVVLLLFPQIVIGVFTNDLEVIEVASVYLCFLSPTFGFIAISLVLGRALNGAGDTFSHMTITLICQVGVGLILAITLARAMGLVGVWIGIALANVLQGVMMWFWHRRGAWKTKQLVSNK